MKNNLSLLRSRNSMCLHIWRQLYKPGIRNQKSSVFLQISWSYCSVSPHLICHKHSHSHKRELISSILISTQKKEPNSAYPANTLHLQLYLLHVLLPDLPSRPRPYPSPTSRLQLLLFPCCVDRKYLGGGKERQLHHPV